MHISKVSKFYKGFSKLKRIRFQIDYGNVNTIWGNIFSLHALLLYFCYKSILV